MKLNLEYSMFWLILGCAIFIVLLVFTAFLGSEASAQVEGVDVTPDGSALIQPPVSFSTAKDMLGNSFSSSTKMTKVFDLAISYRDDSDPYLVIDTLLDKIRAKENALALCVTQR